MFPRPSQPASYRTSMESCTRQSGVALDPTQYPYVDCLLREPHAPIRAGKGQERAKAAKKVIEENHKMLYRIRDAKPIVTLEEHEQFEEAQRGYGQLARHPEISRLSQTLPRQAAPSKSLLLAQGSSLAMSSTGNFNRPATGIDGRPAFDTTPFNPGARPKTSVIDLLPTSQLTGQRPQSTVSLGRGRSMGAKKYQARLDMMYNTGRPFGFRPDSYATGPARINTKVTEAAMPSTLTGRNQSAVSLGAGETSTPGERARAKAMMALSQGDAGEADEKAVGEPKAQGPKADEPKADEPKAEVAEAEEAKAEVAEAEDA